MHRKAWHSPLQSQRALRSRRYPIARAQQKFPTKPIRLVVGLTPGGTLDTLARITSQKMSEN